MMKILYGTSNPSKLTAMKKYLENLDSKYEFEIIGLNDLNSEIPKIIEDGNTPLENARIKSSVYYKLFHIPVFSCDSGLYFENIPVDIQPGVHVRTVNDKYLTDDEMIAYYSSLAKKYGDLTAQYQNAICFIYDDVQRFEEMSQSMKSDKFIITSKPHSIIKKGFPLDSLSVDIKTGKYYYDLPEKIAVENGFSQFFEKAFKQIHIHK
ncbi:hypothetical protein M9Y10_031135 [Tritrichomonas musculus]|uniref:Uncharacterized protein n=1 Tax=Tritrichomonas musculus TaxID=1915356 RepID=A0ABR2H209_9EUKA